MTEKRFSDEELSAFLDGELAPDMAAEINERLSTDSDLAQRLEALKFPVGALQFGAEQLLQSAPDYVEPEVADIKEDQKRFSPHAALLLVGLALGYFSSLYLAAPKSEDWIGAVASYQALYVEETLANANQSSEMTNEVLSSFGTSQNVPASLFTELPSLVFKRAQLLGFEGKPLLQMAFTTDSGKPVALCITPVDETDRSPEFGEYQSLPAADWVKDGKGFILIGDMSPNDMRAVVSTVRKHLG